MEQVARRPEQAWARYVRAWARSAVGTHAGIRDLDPDARRRARRSFMAGWRAAQRADLNALATVLATET